MYGYIRRYLSERAAIVVSAIIYSIMLASILYFSFEKHASFSYLRL